MARTDETKSLKHNHKLARHNELMHILYSAESDRFFHLHICTDRIFSAFKLLQMESERAS